MSTTVVALELSSAVLTIGGTIAAGLDLLGRVRRYQDARRTATAEFNESQRGFDQNATMFAMAGRMTAYVHWQLEREKRERQLADERLEAAVGADAKLWHLALALVVTLAGIVLGSVAGIIDAV